MKRVASRAPLAAIALTATGLCCLVPVLVDAGPVTVGLFMAGVLLVLAGVVLSAVLLPGLLRRERSERGRAGTAPAARESKVRAGRSERGSSPAGE